MLHGNSTDLEFIYETANAYQPLVLDPVVHNKVDVEGAHNWLHLTEIRTLCVNRLSQKSCRMKVVYPCLVCFIIPVLILLILCLVLIKASVVTHPDTIEMSANKILMHTAQESIHNASLNPKSQLPAVQSSLEYEPPPLQLSPQPRDSVDEVSATSKLPMIRTQPPLAPLLPSTHSAEKISLEEPQQKLESLCRSDAETAVKRDSTKVFVKAPKPIEEIEVAVNEITESFISTLKHDEGWLGWLLKRIRKEQKLRAGKQCYTDLCLYRIPCYLSQKFQSKLDFANTGFNDIRSSNTRIRKRRSIEMSEEVSKLEPVKARPLYASVSSAISAVLAGDFSQKSASEPGENKFEESVAAAVQDPSNNVAEKHNESMTLEDVTTLTPSVEKKDLSSVWEHNNADDYFNEQTGTVLAGDLDPSYSDNAFGSPLVNCTGVYAEYCYNSISCMFVKVLEAAVCYCKPGYTGVRCDLYNLPQTLDTLSQFQEGTVDIDYLNPSDSAKLYSVLEATA
ncbi:unnamed protein product [Schistocephalus solidus]|uniref:EGF-like domain-containing protein n=1 Tax=Schistocephalus solidus TaxID=70667 RepID=A0A183SJ15_SCHSO|nr:unnamed protein product [Schistocephalus solidus]